MKIGVLVGIVVGSWFGFRVLPFVIWLWDEHIEEREWRKSCKTD